MGCFSWSRVNLKAEPGVAYLAIPRTGSGSLRALLAKLNGVADVRSFPHNHTCALKGLLETHKARRVLVPLRPLHKRIVSEFERSRRRACRPPAWPPACQYPPALLAASVDVRNAYLDGAAERFVQRLMVEPWARLPYFMRPTSTYLNTNWGAKQGEVRFVCTCTLRPGTTRVLESWGVVGAERAWDGIADRHVTNATTNLSDASIDMLRRRFAKDYALVERYGCGERDCEESPVEGAALARVARSRSVARTEHDVDGRGESRAQDSK